MRELTTKRAEEGLCSGIRDGYSLLELSRDWLKHGNPVVSLELLNSAMASAEAERDWELRANINKETGRAHVMQSDWDLAEIRFREGQRLFLDNEHYKGAAECARNCANMKFQLGNYRESEQLCEQALEWASETNEYELRATITNTLGAIKSATGDHRESINMFKLCLADFQSSGNSIRQGYVLLNIGMAENEIGEYSEGISYLRRALLIAFSEKDLNLVEICYQNISKCYLGREEPAVARSVIETARKILPSVSSPSLSAELDLIESKTMRALGDLDGATTLLGQTLKNAVANKMTALEADALNEQGLLERDKGHTKTAVVKLKAAAGLYRQLGMDRGYRESIQTLDILQRVDNV